MDNRLIAVACVGVAAVLLALGALSGSWLVGETAWADEVRVGLRGAELCVAGDCRAASLDDLSRPLAQVSWLGTVTLILGLASAASLGFAAYMGVTQRGTDWVIAPTTIAIVLPAFSLIVAVITLVVFQARTGGGNIGTGGSFILYGLGASLGVFGAILVGRLPKPDENFFEPPFERA